MENKVEDVVPMEQYDGIENEKIYSKAIIFRPKLSDLQTLMHKISFWKVNPSHCL